MGFMDFLFNKERSEERKVAKLRKTATHMFVQAPERQYALQQLREVGTPEAVEALLGRFNETHSNTTTDLEEKEFTYEILVELNSRPGLDVAGIIGRHLKTSDEKINWPLKVLADLLSFEEMVDLVAGLLADSDTSYQRSPEKKQELILRAIDLRDERLARQVVRFLEDDNETIRFLAADASAKDGYEEVVIEPLCQRILHEDSLRILQRIAEEFAQRPHWVVPEGLRAKVAPRLPSGYTLGTDGQIVRGRAH